MQCNNHARNLSISPPHLEMLSTGLDCVTLKYTIENTIIQVCPFITLFSSVGYHVKTIHTKRTERAISNFTRYNVSDFHGPSFKAGGL